jgi:spermidine/putrescine transport system permease protein
VSGRGGDVAVSRPLRVALRVYFFVFLVVLYLPTALLVIFSFNDSTTASFPLEGFTTRFYRAAWNNPDIVDSVKNSLMVAIVVGLLATTLGLCASYVLARRKVVFKGAISALLLVPLVVPTVALGIALLILYNQSWFPLELGLGAVVVGHVVLALPYTILLILPRIGAIDTRLEEAAQDLGASATQTFRRVILPLTVPSLLAAFLISFITSVDEVVVAVFLLAKGQLTYPVYLYAGLRQPDRVATLIPVASVMILLSFLIAFLAEVLRRRGERRLGLAS